MELQWVSEPILICMTCCIDNGIDTQAPFWHSRSLKKQISIDKKQQQEIRHQRIDKGRMRIIQIFIIIFFTIVSVAQGSEFDNSLTNEEYYRLGIMHSIREMDELYKVYLILFNLSSETKDVLPKYDSPKSGEIYHNIFNTSHILRELAKTSAIEDKIKLLGKYKSLIDKFQSLYMLYATGHNYDDEITRIELMSVHAVLLIYEEYEKYYDANKLNVNDLPMSPQERYIFKTALYEEFCGPVILWPDRKMDKITKAFALATLEEYEKRAKRISFISEYDANYDKKLCFGLMDERRRKLKELKNVKQ